MPIDPSTGAAPIAMTVGMVNPAVDQIAAFNTLFNGVSWDPYFSTTQAPLLASLARTAAASSPLSTNANHRGVLIFLNVTAASGTGGLGVRIAAIDPVSGAAFYLNAVPTAVIATGLTVYALYPGVTAGGTQITNAALPRTWRVDITVGDASSYTYSLAYALCY